MSRSAKGKGLTSRGKIPRLHERPMPIGLDFGEHVSAKYINTDAPGKANRFGASKSVLMIVLGLRL